MSGASMEGAEKRFALGEPKQYDEKDGKKHSGGSSSSAYSSPGWVLAIRKSVTLTKGV